MGTAPRAIVLPTRWVAEALQFRTQRLSTTLGMPPLTDDESILIVGTIVRGLIDERAMWQTYRPFNILKAIEVSPPRFADSRQLVIDPVYTEDEDEIEVRDLYQCNILSPLIGYIEESLMRPNFESRSWTLYSMSSMDSGDTVVYDNGDYRICRYEELVRSGKIQQ